MPKPQRLLTEEEKIELMPIEELQEHISKIGNISKQIIEIEQQMQQWQTMINRLPIANRTKSTQDRENELYELIDELKIEWRKYTTSKAYLKWLGRA